MVTLGIDAHKRTHTVVAMDDLGRQLGQKTTTATTSDEHLAMLRWAARFGDERVWAVEDCRHLSRRLEADLLAAGERIVRVPPKLMAQSRDSARTYGKSDPIDALAVGRAALRHPARSDSVRTWTAPELAGFLRRSAEEEDRDFALWRLLASTGMRRGESLGLRWCDVDLDARTVAITRAPPSPTTSWRSRRPRRALGVDRLRSTPAPSRRCRSTGRCRRTSDL